MQGKKKVDIYPKGYARLVVERLAAKGISTSARNVQYVANFESSNADIEAELLELLRNPPPPRSEKVKPKSEFQLKVEALTKA
jgi:hypothetical protein